MFVTLSLLTMFVWGGLATEQPIEHQKLTTSVETGHVIHPTLKHLAGAYANNKSLTKALEQSPELSKNPMFRPQNILLYSLFDTEAAANEQWYYIGWYSPDYKEKALDEAFFLFTVENGKLLAKMYSIPADKGFSMEWKKKKPFEGLDRSDLDNHLNTVLETADIPGGGLRIFSPEGQPFERKDAAAAAYRYVNFDMHFHPEYIASQTSFLNAEFQPVMIQSLDFKFDKISKNPKSF